MFTFRKMQVVLRMYALKELEIWNLPLNVYFITPKIEFKSKVIRPNYLISHDKMFTLHTAVQLIFTFQLKPSDRYRYCLETVKIKSSNNLKIDRIKRFTSMYTTRRPQQDLRLSYTTLLCIKQNIFVMIFETTCKPRIVYLLLLYIVANTVISAH